ncbi:MAG: D-alanine--D-alanine ligase [Planctomycetes bacterium]|nr:D-alanine--D-alanine ligase [Planctomycetota bacterium]
MDVGLTFNLKQEVVEPAPVEENEEPPSPPDFYAECDSEATIAAVEAALARRHRVIRIHADEHAFETLRRTRPAIVFNLAEGLYGAAREAHLPAMLEMLRIPYTGSDPQTLAIALDKERTKDLVAHHGVPVPRSLTAASPDDVRALPDFLAFPLMVKPSSEGSSKGIQNGALVRTQAELEAQVERVTTLYRQTALVEEYLAGREFTVAILGNGPSARCLPIVEIKFDSLPSGVNPIYSYEAKWIWDRAENPLSIFDCPARIPERLAARISRICLDAYRILRCRDWCRIDVRCNAAGEPFFLEMNPLPGILPKPEDNSCFPKAARAAGLDYAGLINTVLDLACARYGISQRRAATGTTERREVLAPGIGGR